MKMIGILLRKEFKQIFRNRMILGLVLFAPVLQLCILPFAANYEMTNINIAVVDHDHSAFSRRLIEKTKASSYFKLVGNPKAYNAGLEMIKHNKTNLVLEIPHNFGKELEKGENVPLFIAVNAINGPQALMGAAYLQSIIRDFNQTIRVDITKMDAPKNSGIQTSVRNWYNPLLNYKLLMVPGILALLVTMIGGFLSALNIVKEKEAGTIEQINVSPIKKHHFILGKLIPFWVLGLVVFTVGLLVSWLVYGIVPVGSIALLYGFVALYLLAVLGFGLLISTWCETQQQAMLIMFFFMMVFILMGGLFTSIDSMPKWAQIVDVLNPVRYLIEVMRMVVLKGSGWQDLFPQLGTILLFAFGLNGLALLNYRKTT